MFASRSIVPRRAAALSWLALPVLALLPVAFQVSGCSHDNAAPAQPGTDAGVTACLLGKRACECTASGGCDPGLLCSAGRCFDTEGTKNEPPDPDVRPVVRPVVPAVLPNLRDASAPPSDASSDSGSTSGG